MIKKCVICGKKLNITLNKDRTYKGGHYFGKLAFLIRNKISKKEEFEYWECNKCFNGD